MIETVRNFFQNEIKSRWKKIFVTVEFGLFVVSAFASYHFAVVGVFDPEIVAHTFLGAILTYASIAFGFSITGASVSLALPPRFVKMLSENDDGCTDLFSALIFVFAWAGLLHVILVMVSLVGFFCYKDSTMLFGDGSSKLVIGAASLLLALTVYCVVQFLITIITICEVGRMYRDKVINPK